jgi:hypothetical protein
MQTYASSRDDAIQFVRELRRVQVTSAKLTSRKKDEAAPVPPPAFAELGTDYMLREAKDMVMANAHSGRAIARYLRLKLATALSDAEIRRACEWVVRQVDQRDGKI